MTTKQVKQFLNRARRIDMEIDALLLVVQSTRSSLESITQNYEGDLTTGTKNPHKFDKLVELESLVDEKIDNLVEVKVEILNLISLIDDGKQRELLTLYYTTKDEMTGKPLTWEQVAVKMNYSWRRTMEIHGAAIQELQRISA